MSNQSFGIHGHFYQPPREDPITGDIPLEPGAAPYRNWNERIHDQCYRPNAELGNFEFISFNIGPTLMHWMREFDPDTVSKIVMQERINLNRYGVGNAIAQSYHHTILPHAFREDKITQVKWGIADFEYHFGHKPLGMWLPETAVDLETLEVLVDCGIEFTILAPWQADVENVDITQPYWVELPEGKRIAVFFYHQGLSTRVSFDPGATTNADHFVWDTLQPEFRLNGQNREKSHMILIASDGELYGHHQPFREKFLAHLMNGAIKDQPFKATYPGLWLRLNPPKLTIKIRERTSWSCLHGITRWAGSCSCTPNSGWKAPLRQALNEVAKIVDEVYVKTLSPLFPEIWKIRHRYIHVILGELDIKELLSIDSPEKLDPGDERKIQLLLQAQYERQRIFTSCGWYFDDFDRIEPRNNVAYAAQAVWLTYLATGIDLAPKAAEFLHTVKSWRSGLRADAVFMHCIERARDSH
jgi:hypothetical protein